MLPHHDYSLLLIRGMCNLATGIGRQGVVKEREKIQAWKAVPQDHVPPSPPDFQPNLKGEKSNFKGSLLSEADLKSWEPYVGFRPFPHQGRS